MRETEKQSEGINAFEIETQSHHSKHVIVNGVDVDRDGVVRPQQRCATTKHTGFRESARVCSRGQSPADANTEARSSDT